MRKLKKHEYVLLGIFAFVAGFPLATATDGWSFDVVPLGSILSPREVIEQRANNVMMRRENNEIRRICMKRLGDDETVECPDINNAIQVERFLIGKPIHLEASGSGEVMSGALHVTDLGTAEASMLRRFKRTGTCPDGLDKFLPGFGALCLEEVGTAVPMLTDIVRIRAFERGVRIEEGRPTLNSMIEMFKGSRPDR